MNDGNEVAQGMSFSSSAGSQPSPVAEYRAVISTRVLHSDVLFGKNVQRGDLEGAVAQPLEYITEKWPPAKVSDDLGLMTAVLRKILLTLQLGSSLKVNSADEMEAAMSKEYEAFWNTEDNPNAKRFKCNAQILTDGQVIWGFTHPGEGDNFGGLFLDGSGKQLGLDLYLKNQMSLDLYRRLEENS